MNSLLTPEPVHPRHKQLLRIRVGIDALRHTPHSTKTPASFRGDHLSGPGSHGIEGRSPANDEAEDVASNHANQLAPDRLVLLT